VDGYELMLRAAVAQDPLGCADYSRSLGYLTGAEDQVRDRTRDLVDPVQV
jgi:hypothetical protein